MQPVAVPKPCPACGARGHLTIGVRLVARPIGSFSLAGAQMKVSANTRAELACAGCGLSVLGYIDGGDFVADAPPPCAPAGAP